MGCDYKQCDGGKWLREGEASKESKCVNSISCSSFRGSLYKVVRLTSSCAAALF